MIETNELLIFVKRIANKQGKSEPTINDIESILATTDETALIQSWKERVKVNIWDGISNINDATASYILESNPWADIIYTISIDNKIVYMQTHDPFQQGWVPIVSTTFDSVSGAHKIQIAEENASNEILNKILIELNLN